MIDIQKRRLEQQLSDNSKERGKSNESMIHDKSRTLSEINENPNIVTAQSLLVNK